MKYDNGEKDKKNITNTSHLPSSKKSALQLNINQTFDIYK